MTYDLNGLRYRIQGDGLPGDQRGRCCGLIQRKKINATPLRPSCNCHEEKMRHRGTSVIPASEVISHNSLRGWPALGACHGPGLLVRWRAIGLAMLLRAQAQGSS